MDKFKLYAYYQNVRGLRTKTSTFFRNLQLENYDIIALTETWLNDNITDSELFDERYSVWQRIRRYGVTGQSKGGGILLATRRELHALVRYDWCSSAEDLWLTIDVGKSKLHVCVIYLCSENNGPNFSQQLTNFLTKLQDIVATNPTDTFLLCGDFNMSSILWSPSDYYEYLVPSNSTMLGTIETEFLDELNLFDLHQYNHVTNQYGRILDLVLCNVDIISISNISNPLVPLDPHHNALGIIISLSSADALKPAPRTKYIFQRTNFDAFNLDLSEINWHSDLHNLSLEESVNYFYNILNVLRDKYVPKKLIRKRIFPPWYSSALVKVLKEKYKCFCKFKKYKLLTDKQAMDILRDRANRLEENCYKIYINNVEKSIKENPKFFWRYFKTKNTSNYPSVMIFNKNKSSSGIEICNFFADYFHSTFLTPDSDPVNLNYNNNNIDFHSMSVDGDISTVYISDSTVKSKLLKLDAYKSAGPDGIPPILLIKCAEQLSVPLQILFNRSLKEGYMPNVWKMAYISPIHKKGSKNEITNYRPISKLCSIAKVFEKIIYEQLYASISKYLPLSQHGFIRGRSTVSNLILLNDFVSGSMDEGKQVDVVYTDYAKCFDRIDHNILILKLQNAGIRGDLLRWFTSYIRNRSQAVVLESYMSKWMCVPSGVPQGSLLGPLLFLIFISDIDSCFQHSYAISFADDMKILKSISSAYDSSLLQQDLARLDNYCLVNKLDLNVDKCSIMTFTRKKCTIVSNYSLKGHCLNRVTEMKDLGVIHDCKLLYQSQISHIVGKALKSLGFIIRVSKDFKNLKTFKILYSTYVRCHLEYASQIWNPSYVSYIERLERVQRKFLRYLNFRTYSKEKDYFKQCAKHHFLPLKERRDFSDILFLNKIVTSSIDCPEILSKINIYIPSRSFRKSPLLYVPVAKTNYRKNTYMYRACKTFNKIYHQDNLDIDLFVSNLASIKKQLSNTFFSHK